MVDVKYIHGSRKVQDLTGITFGWLTVIKHIGRGVGADRHHRWLCQCRCGEMTNVSSGNLKTGAVKSCGCSTDETKGGRNPNHKHGLSKTYFHVILNNMIARCYNPLSTHYDYYGGRGIAVCDRWRESIVDFANDVGPRPSPRHSIDRINNDGNYEPGNVRWATVQQQSRNTRHNNVLSYQGREMCLKDWASELGMSQSLLCHRLGKLRWSIERALSTPVKRRR